MVAVEFLTTSSSTLDARTSRFLFDIENDESVGDPQVTANSATVNLKGGSIVSFDGDFEALRQALQSGDLETLFLILPLIRIDNISKSFPGGDAVLVTGLGVTGTDLLPFFDEDNIEAGFQHFLRGNDTFVGDLGSESMAGYAGRDIILGMNGNDLIEGGAGDDEINGNRGADVVHGGLDRDFVRGGQENDDVFGDEGDDWHVNGNNGNDTVDGGPGNDTVHGGKDHDFLRGSAGNDFLSGDLGDDTLFGASGFDAFAFDHNSGVDVVGDFDNLNGDVIGIRQDINGILLRTGLDAIARATQLPEGTFIDLGANNFILLAGIPRGSLREVDFVIF